MIMENARLIVWVFLGFTLTLPLPAQAPPVVTAPAPFANSPKDPADGHAYRDAITLRDKGKFDEALAKITEALQQAPQDEKMLVLQGDLYAKKKQWSEAEQAFTAALKINPQDVLAQFDLAEIKLMQKEYTAARPGFLALVKDEDLGDLAAYKVFLCDLYSGNGVVADEELKAFDRVDSRASFYYANAASAFYHQRPDDAKRWLGYATRIYSPEKNHNYLSTLKELGYLPSSAP